MATLLKLVGIDSNPDVSSNEFIAMKTAIQNIEVYPLEQLLNLNLQTPLIFPEEVAKHLTHVLNVNGNTIQSSTVPPGLPASNSKNNKHMFIVRPLLNSNTPIYSSNSPSHKSPHITLEALTITDIFHKLLVYSIALSQIYLADASSIPNKSITETIFDHSIKSNIPSLNPTILQSLTAYNIPT